MAEPRLEGEELASEVRQVFDAIDTELFPPPVPLTRADVEAAAERAAAEYLRLKGTKVREVFGFDPGTGAVAKPEPLMCMRDDTWTESTLCGRHAPIATQDRTKVNCPTCLFVEAVEALAAVQEERRAWRERLVFHFENPVDFSYAALSELMGECRVRRLRPVRLLVGESDLAAAREVCRPSAPSSDKDRRQWLEVVKGDWTEDDGRWCVETADGVRLGSL